MWDTGGGWGDTGWGDSAVQAASWAGEQVTSCTWLRERTHWSQDVRRATRAARDGCRTDDRVPGPLMQAQLAACGCLPGDVGWSPDGGGGVGGALGGIPAPILWGGAAVAALLLLT